MDRALAWELTEGSGIEIAFAALSDGRMAARGTALRVEPVPYRLDYEFDTADNFVTRSLRVQSEGVGWARILDLERGSDGRWSVEVTQRGDVDLPQVGGDDAAFQDALDCDLGLSPLTNTMPVLRHDLLGEGSLEFTMAWVSVPDLAVYSSHQGYEHIRTLEGDGAVVRYRSLDGTFVADISFDADGFVIDYPGLARRIP